MNRTLNLAVAALFAAGSLGVVTAPMAEAATGNCTYVHTWSTSARSSTVSAITCSGARKVRAVLQYYSSSSGSTLYTNKGAWAGTGGVSHTSKAAPAVAVYGYAEKN